MIKKIIKYFYKVHLKYKKNIIIHKKVYIDFETVFEGKNVINKDSQIFNSKVGFASYIGPNSIIENCTIGKYCSVGPFVRIVTGTHPTSKFVSTHPAFFSTQKQAGFTYVKDNKFDEVIYINKEKRISVEIGNDVWIGENVTILGGIKIGDGAIIGANAVVTKNIEPYSINVGIPSKKIGFRFCKEDIDFLEEKQWWNYPEQWIIENANKFNDINEIRKVT